MPHDLPTLTVLDVPVAMSTPDAVLTELGRRLDGFEPTTVMFANAHALNVAARDEVHLSALRQADLVLNDGSGLALAARLHGRPFPANLNGTDFCPKLLAMAARQNASVFLYGGRPGVAERAATSLRQDIPGLRVVGTSHGFRTDESVVVKEISAARADIVIVALGVPLQEKWLVRNLASTGAKLGVAVGAFLDFTAGEVRRAPAWMRRAGIEWLYRLLGEPRRLFARYVLGNPLFLTRVALEWGRRI